LFAYKYVKRQIFHTHSGLYSKFNYSTIYRKLPRRQWLRGKQKVERVKFEHQPLENDAVSVVSKAGSSLRNHQPKILSESIHLTGNIIWYFLWGCGRVVLAVVENVLGINI
jgi:predicted thioredoxin/glutaredoxin